MWCIDYWLLNLGVMEDGWAKGWMEGATILIAVVIIVSISAGNNYVKEQQFLKLNAKREEMSVQVTRNGQVSWNLSLEKWKGNARKLGGGGGGNIQRFDEWNSWILMELSTLIFPAILIDFDWLLNDFYWKIKIGEAYWLETVTGRGHSAHPNWWCDACWRYPHGRQWNSNGRIQCHRGKWSHQQNTSTAWRSSIYIFFHDFGV